MDLREELKKKKPIFGLQNNLKKIRKQKLSKVYVSSNSHAKEEITRLCKTMSIEINFTEETSKDLGILCKKPFSISVIGFE